MGHALPCASLLVLGGRSQPTSSVLVRWMDPSGLSLVLSTGVLRGRQFRRLSFHCSPLRRFPFPREAL
jgi:hypothetical protein